MNVQLSAVEAFTLFWNHELQMVHFKYTKEFSMHIMTNINMSGKDYENKSNDKELEMFL